MRHSTTNNFPASYRYIWNKEHSKNAIVKIKALLKDYTKEESLISPFFGRLFFLHWNRHHVPAVQKIIYKRDYERAEDILFDLRQIDRKSVV